jgi:hypothetical protein
MNEILIYGLKQGATHDYMEDLLACFKMTDKAQENIARVKEAASAAGFHSFRVATYSGKAPNFAAAVNV